jgi:serine/threonine-protein kinase
VVSKGKESSDSDTQSTPDDTQAQKSVWKSNTNVNLGDSYEGGNAKVVLTQNGKDTVLVNGAKISNPYNVNVTGQTGVSSGTVTFYEDRGDGYVEIATATITFKKQ